MCSRARELRYDASRRSLSPLEPLGASSRRPSLESAREVDLASRRRIGERSFARLTVDGRYADRTTVLGASLRGVRIAGYVV